MGLTCLVGSAALLGLLYKVLSSVWIVLYPHILAKRLGHVIDLKSLGKWAVITGATDGIGKGYAKELARRGLNIFIISRNQDRLNSTADEIRKIAPNVDIKTLAIDFGKADANTYQTKITEALKDLEIGVLVNNVGMSYQYPEELLKIRGGTEEYLQNLIAVNCTSTLLMTKIVLPAMVGREKGAVINIGSSLSFNPAPYLTIYSACKAFVDFFSRGLRSEYADSGVIIQAVYPFYVATKMSGVTKKSFWTASPDEFAASALDTVGVVDLTCGNFPHEILGILVNLVPSFLLTIAIKKALKDTRERYLRKEQKQQQEKKEE